MRILAIKMNKLINTIERITFNWNSNWWSRFRMSKQVESTGSIP